MLHVWSLQSMVYHYYSGSQKSMTNVCVKSYYTYCEPASNRLSARDLLNMLSLSITPHEACKTESRRQSPAVRFHSAYRRLPSRSVISRLQLIAGSSSSRSAKENNLSLRFWQCPLGMFMTSTGEGMYLYCQHYYDYWYLLWTYEVIVLQ